MTRPTPPTEEQRATAEQLAARWCTEQSERPLYASDMCRLRDMVLTALAAEREAGRREERGRVVAYLSGVGEQHASGDMLPQDDFAAEAYEEAAEHIKRGNHTRPDGGDHG